jgi:hypothetical protein
MLPWKPQCGENQLRGGFIGHSGDNLQQQNKLKFLTNFPANFTFLSRKTSPADGYTAQQDLVLYGLICTTHVRPRNGLYGLYRFSLLYGLSSGAGMVCKQPSWLRKFGLNLAYSLLAAVLKWPLFAAQNAFCWLPKLGPGLALFASAAPSASLAQAPSSSLLPKLTNENTCPTPPSTSFYLPSSPHLP